MAIAPIPGVATGITPVGTSQLGGAGAAAPSGQNSFAAGLEAVSKATQHADALGQQVATGQLQDIHQFMAASAKANLAVELTVAVRNKAVEAYQEIMRMQV
jgi:flagellar hook-basal body complex protein FliE